jgi:hypothetical protein
MTCKVTVKVPITKVKINKSSKTVKKGKSFKLTATIVPSNTTDSKTIKWASSNKKVVKVSGKGKTATVKAVGKGKATITATTSNGKKVTCKVTVTAKSTAAATTQHTHVYDVPVYKTVHHDAVTETEEVEVYGWVPITEAKEVQVCSKCGIIMYNQGEIDKHFFENNHGGYHSDFIEVDTGETEWAVTGYKTKKVVVKKAYNEKVVDYYKCSCGAKK